jgi:hypothetical protein
LLLFLCLPNLQKRTALTAPVLSPPSPSPFRPGLHFLPSPHPLVWRACLSLLLPPDLPLSLRQLLGARRRPRPTLCRHPSAPQPLMPVNNSCCAFSFIANVSTRSSISCRLISTREETQQSCGTHRLWQLQPADVYASEALWYVLSRFRLCPVSFPYVLPVLF